MAKTRAQKNREIRQEALRDQLEAQGHVQHVVDIADKLRSLDNKMESLDVTRLKAAADVHIKMIDKYLPNLQSVNLGIENHSDDLEDMTNAELARFIIESRKSLSQSDGIDGKPDKVH